MVPMVSSRCKGLLGVCQLPRTWWKVLLGKKGLLDEEYPDCSGGLDSSVLNVLGIDIAGTLSYLRENTPDYLTFESWIKEQTEGSFDLGAISKWNERVETREHRPAKIEETYRDIGFGREVSIKSAAILNALQDWQLFHKRDFDTDFASALSGRVVPLIGNADYGPMEVRQLPRTWYKILLASRGLLHPDYPAMTDSGLDPQVLKVLNLDVDSTMAYIQDSQPTYLTFEGWALEQNAGEIDRSPVDKWNEFIVNREHKGPKQIDIHKNLGRKWDPALTSAVLLNQIEDWHLAYSDLI